MKDVLLAGSVIFLLLSIYQMNSTENKYLEIQKENVILLDSVNTLNNLNPDYKDWNHVIATKYNAVREQCDESFDTTADGTKIDFKKLSNYHLKYIAVSQDLRSKYKYGDTVTVLSSNKNLSGEWIVKDAMNKRHRNRVDFLVPIKDTLKFHEPTAVVIFKKK